MEISDRIVYGENYYTAGRYNYTCIDRTHENSSGSQDCLSGLSKKLANSICHRLREAQLNSLLNMLVGFELGDSANSEEIVLYATNEGKLYKEHFTRCIKTLKEILDTKAASAYRYKALFQDLQSAFCSAWEMYCKDFPEDTAHKNFTMLDASICAHNWVQIYKAEYAVNQLSGY